MANELEIRAQIDTENVKALLLINGGAAVALLAFLGSVLGEKGCEPLAQGILCALLIYQLGLLAAVVHNRLRRKCSLKYQQHEYTPPRCEILGRKLAEPCICMWSIFFLWGSVLAFVAASIVVYFGAVEVIGVCGVDPNTA